MSQVLSSSDAFVLLKEHFNPLAEELWILALDSQLKLISQALLFRGTVDHCHIHPRDIFRFAVIHNASSFLLAHNHPSHVVLPSDQDLIITRKLIKLAAMMEVPLNDHLIFSDTKYFSMADNGLLTKQITRRRGLK